MISFIRPDATIFFKIRTFPCKIKFFLIFQDVDKGISFLIALKPRKMGTPAECSISGVPID